MDDAQLSGSDTLTSLVQKLAHALSVDPAVSGDTREAAEWLLKCLDTMDQCDCLIAVQH